MVKPKSRKMVRETAVRMSTSSGLVAGDPSKTPVLFVGQQKHLQALDFSDVAIKLDSRVSESVWQSGVKSLLPSPSDSVSLYLNVCNVASLPNKVSRHNSDSRASSITKAVKNIGFSAEEQYIVLVVERANVYASVCAVARAFPLYNRKSSYLQSESKEVVIIETILVGNDQRQLSSKDLTVLEAAIEGVRLAARIVDTPANEMDTAAFVEEIKLVGQDLKIKPFIISGEELKEKGFGGIYGVGKAAEVPPALVVLSHTPEGATQNIAWVGKGIVYDTGGLSMKTKTSMPGMKRDCGGAAGILGAFLVAVKAGFSESLHAIFCLAENAVGPKATKPDDIHTMYSGRTVEINNTDAEGRLVLADGVAFALHDLHCNTILDMATLTGAQGTATGKYHAGVLSNCENMEMCVVEAGKRCGDLAHPLPFSPELHFTEFSSCVADMKNSAADRCNAASSCAGLFILSQLGFDFQGKWVHIDMASPVCHGERATGYGVALLPCLFAQHSRSDLLSQLGPSLPFVPPISSENNNDAKPDGNPPSSKKTRLE